MSVLHPAPTLMLYLSCYGWMSIFQQLRTSHLSSYTCSHLGAAQYNHSVWLRHHKATPLELLGVNCSAEGFITGAQGNKECSQSVFFHSGFHSCYIQVFTAATFCEICIKFNLILINCDFYFVNGKLAWNLCWLFCKLVSDNTFFADIKL